MFKESGANSSRCVCVCVCVRERERERKMAASFKVLHRGKIYLCLKLFCKQMEIKAKTCFKL